MKSKTVLVVTPYLPPSGGGLERYAVEIGRRLHKNHGWKVVFVTSDTGRDRHSAVSGMPVYFLKADFRISNTPFSLSWYSKLKKIIASESPDIIHIHTPVAGIGNLAAAAAGTIPVVVTYHSGSMKKGRLTTDLPVVLYENLILPLMLGKACAIVCSSDFVRDSFLSSYSERTSTITPGTDTSAFTPARSGSGHPPAVLFVAGLNRSEQHKGLDLLLRSVASIRPHTPDLRLLVVGEGDMKSSYQTMARELGISEMVTFLGRLEGKSLIRVFHRADVFALPSRNDSFPTVIIEAMSCGLPVVSTPVGGIPALVGDGQTGFLVPPDNLKALSDRLYQLLTDRRLAASLGRRGRKKALTLDWNLRAGEYHRLLTGSLHPAATIVHVAAYYPPHVGGLESVAENAACFSAGAGYPTLVLTSDRGQIPNDSRKAQNPKVIAMHSLEFAHTPFAPALLWHLARIPSNSLIHLHLAQAFFPEAVLLTSKLRKIPYVAHFHLDVGPSGLLGPLFVIYKSLVWGPVLRNARRVVICSPDQKALVTGKFGVSAERISVIPNGVNEDFFTDRKPVRKRKTFRLLYVGRLTIQKRVDRLIRAMRLLKIPATLTIVGDGEDRQKLEKLTRSLRLKNIYFAGARNLQEIRTYHRRHDSLLISSDREGGTPLVVLEAMASGLPVIGSDVVGISGLLSGVGLLVKDPYPKNFARAITDLWHHPGRLRSLSDRSISRAENFRWSGFSRRLIDIYRQFTDT